MSVMMFTSAAIARDRSERLIDKLVCYFMVVTLWIHDYTIDLNDIAGATRIKIKK